MDAVAETFAVDAEQTPELREQLYSELFEPKDHKILSIYDEDYLREIVFTLCYTQHGGSGLAWQRDEVLSLELSEALWYAERLAEERKREAQAMRDAYRKGAA